MKEHKFDAHRKGECFWLLSPHSAHREKEGNCESVSGARQSNHKRLQKPYSHRQTHTHTHTLTDRYTDRQTDRYSHRQTDTDRQTDMCITFIASVPAYWRLIAFPFAAHSVCATRTIAAGSGPWGREWERGEERGEGWV